jgi:glycosyltransferase involved in cell wall biosynthesis
MDFNSRVALVSPTLVRSDYVQPLLRELARLFPGMLLLCGEFPGFLPTCCHSFEVKKLPGMRTFGRDDKVKFRWLPFSVFRELRRTRVHIVLLGQFTMWTFYIALYKALYGCRIFFLWDGTVPSCASIDSPLRLFWRRMLARSIDAAISNTHEGVDYLSHVIHIPRSKIRQSIYLVADVDSLCCECKNDSPPLPYNGRPVFLYVGSLSQRKGVQVLLRAVAQLVQSDVHDFSVMVVGDGNQDYLRRSMSSESEPHIQIVGPVKYTELGKFYENCDAFILPSREDVWGMVVSEAMAFGKAILCSKYANAKEVVKHGVNGFIFDPLHPTELSSYMLEIIRNRWLVEQFGTASRVLAEQYTPVRAARSIAEVLIGLKESKMTKITTRMTNLRDVRGQG